MVREDNDLEFYLEKLKGYFVSERYKEEILRAQEEFGAKGGELNGEGREDRLAFFFDWFIFERPLASAGVPPMEHYMEKALYDSGEDEAYRHIIQNRRSMFLVKGGKNGEVKLKDLFSGELYRIAGADTVFERGDIVETRLVNFYGRRMSTGVFRFYPGDMYGIICEEFMDARLDDNWDPLRLIDNLHRLKSMCERYRNTGVKKIYRLMKSGMLKEGNAKGSRVYFP